MVIFSFLWFGTMQDDWSSNYDVDHLGSEPHGQGHSTRCLLTSTIILYCQTPESKRLSGQGCHHATCNCSPTCWLIYCGKCNSGWRCKYQQLAWFPLFGIFAIYNRSIFNKYTDTKMPTILICPNNIIVP